MLLCMSHKLNAVHFCSWQEISKKTSVDCLPSNTIASFANFTHKTLADGSEYTSFVKGFSPKTYHTHYTVLLLFIILFVQRF